MWRKPITWLFASLVFALSALAVFVFSLGNNSTQAPSRIDNINLGAFTVPADYPNPTQPYGEVGPGACWPKDETPGANDAAGFAEENGPQMASDWLREHPTEAERLDRFYNAHADYYLVKEVVPSWDTLAPAERVADYVQRLVYIKLPANMLVLNHYCKDNDVLAWKTQVLPQGEIVFFVPGHEPGTTDIRPAHKAVCGNPLLPPETTTPEATPSTSPSETPTGGPTTTPPTGLPGKSSAPQPRGVEKPTNNPVAPLAESRPTADNENQLKPPPVVTTTTAPKATRTVPPAETAAPAASNPGTHAGCPPGISVC